ncbi:MAG: hypothetical protein NVS9B10_09060 [Nevskia sp.]
MSDINETDLKVFADAVTHYFSHLTREPAVVHAAYLAEASIPHFDYTGLITLSGRFRGCVYFSASRPMVLDLLRALQEPDASESNLLDAVGEVANTIAGSARRHFGRALEISVPVAIRGSSERIKAAVRTRPFAILVSWRGHDTALVVDLEAAG